MYHMIITIAQPHDKYKPFIPLQACIKWQDYLFSKGKKT
jgi:hypothetical protein